ncbi:hypothetical protein FB451DRAFT_1397017 [Mycena latifolia]|nr:hypothetical protein FB451DRAFT_1397017 [Mycena latifolia]
MSVLALALSTASATFKSHIIQLWRLRILPLAFFLRLSRPQCSNGTYSQNDVFMCKRAPRPNHGVIRSNLSNSYLRRSGEATMLAEVDRSAQNRAIINFIRTAEIEKRLPLPEKTRYIELLEESYDSLRAPPCLPGELHDYATYWEFISRQILHASPTPSMIFYRFHSPPLTKSPSLTFASTTGLQQRFETARQPRHYAPPPSRSFSCRPKLYPSNLLRWMTFLTSDVCPAVLALTALTISCRVIHCYIHRRPFSYRSTLLALAL